MTQKSRVVVFDLDDTLYKEQDYLKSAYREIAAVVESRYGAPRNICDQMFRWWQKGDNVFQQLIDTYKLELTIDELLTIALISQLFVSMIPSGICLTVCISTLS